MKLNRTMQDLTADAPASDSPAKKMKTSHGQDSPKH